MIKWIKNLRNKPETIEEPEDESLVKKFDKNQYTGSWAKPKMNIGAACDKIFARKHDSLKLCSLDGDLVSAMDAESVAAMDSGFDTSSLYPNDVPEKILEFFGAHGFIGWQACAILRQNYLIDAACSIPANDAMATGYKLSYAENNETESDKKDDGVEDEELAKIERDSDETYHIGEVCRRMTVNKKTFGIALAIPIVKGADMTKPFNIDGIKKGTYKGFSVVEPYWAAPQMDSDAASDPASLHFYEPTWWRIGGGELVHRSWCIKIVNTTLPDILKPSYYYGGVPLTQMIYERVYAADTTANEAPLLAKSKRLLIADADVSNMIANPAEAKDITEASSYFRDNWNIWFKNPLDQVSQIDTSLAGLDEVIMTQYQLCASIAEMPATKLLKTSPKGFNATGDYEWKDYAQTLVEIQEHDFKPIIQMHNMLYTKSTTGKEIPLIVTFAPVDVPTDKELAEVEEIRSRVDTNYSNSGVVSPEEIRDIARNADGSRFSTLPEISESDMDIDSDAEELSNKVAEDAAFLDAVHMSDGSVWQ